jgi:hypothetical protein
MRCWVDRPAGPEQLNCRQYDLVVAPLSGNPPWKLDGSTVHVSSEISTGFPALTVMASAETEI